MNPLKKGPEIKLSSLKPSGIKVPQVLADLYWDLRDRYLLPAVVVLVAAIVAVPLVLGGSSNSDWQDELAEAGLSEGATTSSAAPAATGELVAKAAPGLRDYRRRLRDLKETDPFVQQFSGSESAAVASGGGGTEASSSGSASAPAPAVSAPPEVTEDSPPVEPTPDSSRLAWFSYAIDVRIVPMGQAGGAAGRASASGSEATVRRNLPELTVLPNKGTPAAIYMGVTKDGKKALLMLSDQVQGVFGDGVCVLGSATCQLLAIEPGLPVTVVYGPAERTFRIELLKLRLLRGDKLNRAPLGSGGGKQDKSAWGLSQRAPRP